MSDGSRDRWLSIALAVGLHGLIAAAFLYGWLLWKRPPPPVQALAIDATVVDAQTLNRVTQPAAPTPPAAPAEVESAPAPTPTPTPTLTETPTPAPTPQPASVTPPLPAPAPEPPPEPPPPTAKREPPATAKPSAADIERAKQAAVAAHDAALAADQKAADRAAAERAAKERLAAERAAAERAAAERKAREAEELARAAAAEAKAKADAERQAREAQERAATEADLRRRLAEEEHVAAVQASGEQSRWVAQIQARIQRAWIRPPSARPGISCTVIVTQIPGGEVVSAKVTTCNGDEAVRLSIEAAVLRASPLPLPPDPALFQRTLELVFNPD